MSSVNQREFESLYLGNPGIPTARETLALALAQQYIEECESFDRTVCTGPIKRGAILPMNGRELGLICRNAKEVKKRILRDNPGVTEPELRQAIKQVDRHG
jgi:hypothetical protein